MNNEMKGVCPNRVDCVYPGTTPLRISRTRFLQFGKSFKRETWPALAVNAAHPFHPPFQQFNKKASHFKADRLAVLGCLRCSAGRCVYMQHFISPNLHKPKGVRRAKHDYLTPFFFFSYRGKRTKYRPLPSPPLPPLPPPTPYPNTLPPPLP